jgi:cardiolipin synthase A/B
MTPSSGARATATPSPAPTRALPLSSTQRGARVRVLLNSFFDDEDGRRSNRSTAEGLDLEVWLGNPTGGGIHAKLYLVRVGG